MSNLPSYLTPTKEDVDRKIDTTWDRLTIAKVENFYPKGALVGGQPGAGKSALITAMVEQYPNIVVINPDDYRQYHPYFKEIVQKYGDSSAQYTGQFAEIVATEMINRAIEHKYNLVIEGSFKSSNLPISRLEKLKKNWYETEVLIQTTSISQSWESTLERSSEAEKLGIPVRVVPRNYHDNVVAQLPKNADVIYKSGLADRFRVYSREALLFDSTLQKNMMPSVYIEYELNKTAEQDRQAINGFRGRENQQKIEAFINNPEEAVKNHPELVGSYAAMIAIQKKVAEMSLTPEQRKIIMQRVQDNITKQIEQGVNIP